MARPLALVALATTGTRLFQTLMFNDLDRFFRDFDLLTTRQDHPGHLPQTFPTPLAIIRAMLDDLVWLVAELERCPASSLLPARWALRFRLLARRLAQSVTRGWLVAVLTVFVETPFQIDHSRFQGQKQIDHFFRLAPTQFKQFVSSRHPFTLVTLSLYATMALPFFSAE